MRTRARRIAAVVSLVAISAWTPSARALDSLFLVRHAEKQSDWPPAREWSSMQPLSAQGLRRATGLAARFDDVPLVAVISSPTTRTMHTALFTARAHDLELTVEPRTIDRDEIPGLLDELRRAYPGPGAILVVGHSNTVPWFFDAVGVDAACHERLGVTLESYGPATEGYDGLWEVDLRASGCAAVTRHEFVVPDPAQE